MEIPTSDGAYLQRFLDHQDQDAFALLVDRHGPMVLATCRRICGDHGDAEDALQATFLTLSLKATSLRGRHCLAGWLHTVARHVSLRLRSASDSRHSREQDLAMRTPTTSPTPSTLEVSCALDAALEAVPEPYRLAILLHHVQSRSHEDVALELGITTGTLAVRLSRGRDLLRRRLQSQGIGVSAMGTMALLPVAMPGSLPFAQSANIGQQAVALSTGLSSGVPPTVLQLAQATAKSMTIPKAAGVGVLISMTLCVMVGIMLGGWSLLSRASPKASISAASASLIMATPQAPLSGRSASAPALTTFPAVAPFQNTQEARHDEAWVAEATSGWCGGQQIPTNRAFLEQIPLPLNPQLLSQLPSVQVGGSTAAFADAHLGLASTWSPIYRSQVLTDPHLEDLAYGNGWVVAQPGTRTLAVLVSPYLAADQEWTPYLLARDGSTLTCICDMWSDDRPHESIGRTRRAMLVDLGELSPGSYTFRFLQRTFHDEGARAGHFHPIAFDSASVLLQVAPAGAHTRTGTGMAVKSGVAASTGLQAVLGDAGGPAWFTRGGRELPRALTLSLADDGTRDASQAAVAMGRFPVQRWLLTQPSSATAIPSLLMEDPTQSQHYLVLIGPRLEDGGNLELCDLFWVHNQATAPSSLTVRVNLWRDRAAGSRSAQIPILILALPAGDPPGLNLDWTLFGQQPSGIFERNMEFASGVFGMVGSQEHVLNLQMPEIPPVMPKNHS